MPIIIKQATKDIAVTNNDRWVTETEPNPVYDSSKPFDVQDITTFSLKPKYHDNYAIVNTWQGNQLALVNKPFKSVDINKINIALHQWLNVVGEPASVARMQYGDNLTLSA